MNAVMIPTGRAAVQDFRATRALARRGSRRVFRLWLPLTPLTALLAPLALLALPFVAARRGLSPWPVLVGLGGVLAALSGTIVELDSPTAHVSIRIW